MNTCILPGQIETSVCNVTENSRQNQSLSLTHKSEHWKGFLEGGVYTYISSGVYMQSKKKKKKILIQMHQKEPRPLQSYSANSMHQSVLFHLHSKLGILLKRNTLYFLSFYCYCLLYCRWTWMKQVPVVTCIIIVIPSLDSRTFIYLFIYFLNWTENKPHVKLLRKHKSLWPEDTKLQLYLWQVQSDDTQDSFLK